MVKNSEFPQKRTSAIQELDNLEDFENTISS